MRRYKKAMMLVYVIVLINIAVILWAVIVYNAFTLMMDYKIINVDKLLSYDLSRKWKFTVTLSRQFNSDGGWFNDNFSCPDPITMSGFTYRDTNVSSSMVFSWGIYCSWSYRWNFLEIYLDETLTDFIWVNYWWSYVDLSTWTLDREWLLTFEDSDITKIEFSGDAYIKPDGIDDDFNSDNYNKDSIDNIVYPWNYEDNDDKSRKYIYWYIPPDEKFYNIFWSNSQIIDFIKNNSNNDYWVNLDNQWYLYLNLSSSAILKIVKFDKTVYNSLWELLPVGNGLLEKELLWSLWYVQNDLNLSSAKTWNEYIFDFTSYDYAIFLKNTWSDVLSFNLQWESLSWEKMYINPVNDSWDNIEVLTNTVMIDADGRYFWKVSKFVWEKKFLSWIPSPSLPLNKPISWIASSWSSGYPVCYSGETIYLFSDAEVTTYLQQWATYWICSDTSNVTMCIKWKTKSVKPDKVLTYLLDWNTLWECTEGLWDFPVCHDWETVYLTTETEVIEYLQSGDTYWECWTNPNNKIDMCDTEGKHSKVKSSDVLARLLEWYTIWLCLLSDYFPVCEDWETLYLTTSTDVLTYLLDWATYWICWSNPNDKIDMCSDWKDKKVRNSDVLARLLEGYTLWLCP